MNHQSSLINQAWETATQTKAIATLIESVVFECLTFDQSVEAFALAQVYQNLDTLVDQCSITHSPIRPESFVRYGTVVLSGLGAEV